MRSGDQHYRGMAIATSKFTGDPRQSSLLVVRSDDSATGLDDLAGAEYGYINTSCTSSYFSPAILLTRLGKTWDTLHFVPVPAWQGQIDAVVSKKVRATMVLEDVWTATPENAESTKVIGRYDNCKPPVVIASKTLDNGTCGTLLNALLAWEPDWNVIFGGLKPDYTPTYTRSSTTSINSRPVCDGCRPACGHSAVYVMDVWLVAAERQRSHGDLVNLSAGQPSAGAPQAVRAAAKAALEGRFSVTPWRLAFRNCARRSLRRIRTGVASRSTRRTW